MALKLAKPLPKGAEYLLPIVESVGPIYGVSPYLLLGVCYAESNFGGALKPVGPTGSGDFIPRLSTPARDQKMKEAPLPGVERRWLEKGIPARKIDKGCWAWVPTTNGWGCGLMQLDYESFYEFCKGGEWVDPAKSMDFAANMLAKKRAFLAKKFPALKGEDLVRATIAAYNAGEGRVAQYLTAGKSLDECTFHPGYVDKIAKKADELAGIKGAYASLIRTA